MTNWVWNSGCQVLEKVWFIQRIFLVSVILSFKGNKKKSLLHQSCDNRQFLTMELPSCTANLFIESTKFPSLLSPAAPGRRFSGFSFVSISAVTLIPFPVTLLWGYGNPCSLQWRIRRAAVRMARLHSEWNVSSSFALLWNNSSETFGLPKEKLYFSSLNIISLKTAK